MILIYTWLSWLADFIYGGKGLFWGLRDLTRELITVGVEG